DYYCAIWHSTGVFF
nr:immunoglobulin light chain junction region [Macaca mulatta]MOW66602.1 immunoglobulin light chain junction region [Macaca mulatta]MOW67679.1 immunoglobulin light chain junction region [Macaca mulatta]MOW68100.1 immunoglobulin light chain junction region [Macaca mulatta]MOW68500.1 immunoglobulin light chain junction region [Macaca mulatta]